MNHQPSAISRQVGACVLAALVSLAGCASSAGPQYLRVDSSRYEQAFDAALAAARDHKLAPTLRDRRGGLIETDPVIAASVLDFWRGGNTTFGQAVENTMAFQRRHARFEFTPAGAAPAPPAPATPGSPGTPGTPGTVPDLLGGETVDLSRVEGDLELRVQVVVERCYEPGVRRDTWTRRLTTTAVIRRPATDPTAPTGRYWTPVARDPAFERRLLAAVEDALRQ